MQVCFKLSTAALRAINNILVAQVVFQGASIWVLFCMVNFPISVTGVVESGSAVGIRV